MSSFGFIQAAAFSALVVVQIGVAVVYKLSQTGGKYNYSPSSSLTIAETIKLCMSLAFIFYAAHQAKQSVVRKKVMDPDTDAEGASDVEQNQLLNPTSTDQSQSILHQSTFTIALQSITNELTTSFVLSIFGLALLYAINNQLAFVLFLYVDPASITLFKSWSTGMSALILWKFFSRPIGRLQWAAIVLQVVGLIIVQYDPCKGASTVSLDSYMLLMLSVSITAVCSVWNEQVVKKQNASLNVQNAVLYSFGAAMNLAVFIFAPATYPAAGLDPTTGEKVSFFAGYTAAAVAVIACNSVLGLVITAVYKYADAIIKTFATATATAALLFINTILFDINASLVMYLGTTVVFVATYIYINGADPPAPSTTQSK